jgi:hypothetical protein
MRVRQSITYCLISLFITFSQASAWGPDGHHTVAAIADHLIAGTNAARQVKAILGDLSLQDAAVWADCTKGIVPSENFAYHPDRIYPECKVFETADGEAEMADFVRRNLSHGEYHYTDVAIQHDRYDRSLAGTRDDDIVGAVVAATHVLKGEPAPAPFNFKNKREALLLLSHYVGDIHQPLHVGAIYLDANGESVNPDTTTFDPKTDTHGGNYINVPAKATNLHSMWDAVPASFIVSHLNTEIFRRAKNVSVTKGQVYDWPASWASATLGAAGKAFKGLKFSPLQKGYWTATLPANYSAKMNDIKKTQIVDAGARLAQLLEAIWP